MRTLHLGCMPFPTAQGTQALVGTMVEVLREQGHDAHLLTYAAGRRRDEEAHQHRLEDFPRARRTSHRSGPSALKIVLDVRMIEAVRRTWRRLGQCPVVAHNVEAALVARAARVTPRVYVAHTRFDTELPTFWPGTRRLGAWLDHAAIHGATGCAIVPALADHLQLPWLPVPWRAQRSSRAGGQGILYAGNLDAYQGWSDVVTAAAICATPLTVATESDPAPLLRWANQMHLSSLRILPLKCEADRRAAHDAATIAVVPRRAPGGLPIKLLDALARDLPVVAQRRALGGLNPAGVAICADDDPRSMASSIDTALASPPTGGAQWVAGTCAPKRFVEKLSELVTAARAR